MAALLRSPPTCQTLKTLITQQTPLLRSFSTAPSYHNHHRQNHKYVSPSEFINSWDPPKDPKEAESKLAHLRRQYAKQVKEVRKEYIQEMELQRIEKQRKDEAKKEALRIANEERKAAKMAAKKAKAAERQLVEEEFRQTLVCGTYRPLFCVALFLLLLKYEEKIDSLYEYIYIITFTLCCLS